MFAREDKNDQRLPEAVVKRLEASVHFKTFIFLVRIDYAGGKMSTRQR